MSESSQASYSLACSACGETHELGALFDLAQVADFSRHTVQCFCPTRRAPFEVRVEDATVEVAGAEARISSLKADWKDDHLVLRYRARRWVLA